MNDRQQFLRSLGFVDDPFAHTNADDEDRLPEYFVRPPYFAEVFGDPIAPKSFFVFAPRGGGKTAQRIMMEKQCAQNDVLSITYVDFDFFPVASAKDITLELHVRRILGAGWLGILASLYDDSDRVSKLSQASRSIVAERLFTYVSQMNYAQYSSTLSSLKGRFERFKEDHSTITGTVSYLVNAVWKVIFRTEMPSHNSGSNSSESRQFYAKHELEILIQIAKEIGYLSVYVLVDRVDESELTGNNPLDSFILIQPIVRSLKTLETPGLGFKFFLWDAIEPHFKDVGRDDRVASRRLEWTHDKLSELLRKRLLAYSSSSKWRLDQIGESMSPFNIDELVIMFANESPRDLIRICRKIVVEQEQLDRSRSSISGQAVAYALDGVCRELLGDRFSEKHIGQLRQVGTHRNQVDFTVSHVAVSLRISTESSRSRIQKWKNSGAIVELSRVANPGTRKGRRVKLFGVADIRLARLMCSQLSVIQFVEKKVRKCKNSNCSHFILRDWDEADSTSVCHLCFFDSDRQFFSPSDDLGDERGIFDRKANQLHLFVDDD